MKNSIKKKDQYVDSYYNPYSTNQAYEIEGNKKNTNNEIFISRKIASNFIKNQFHQSLVQNRIDNEDFKIVIDQINNITHNFQGITVSFIFMGLFIIFGLLFMILGFYLEEIIRKRISYYRFEDSFIIGLGFIIIGIVLFGILIIVLLVIYQKKIEKLFLLINPELKNKGISFKIGFLCNEIILILSNFSIQEYLVVQKADGEIIEKKLLNERMAN